MMGFIDTVRAEGHAVESISLARRDVWSLTRRTPRRPLVY
jgi:hypothetical protein